VLGVGAKEPEADSGELPHVRIASVGAGQAGDERGAARRVVVAQQSERERRVLRDGAWQRLVVGVHERAQRRRDRCVAGSRERQDRLRPDERANALAARETAQCRSDRRIDDASGHAQLERSRGPGVAHDLGQVVQRPPAQGGRHGVWALGRGRRIARFAGVGRHLARRPAVAVPAAAVRERRQRKRSRGRPEDGRGE
jgi:hypothetical protein